MSAEEYIVTEYGDDTITVSEVTQTYVIQVDDLGNTVVSIDTQYPVVDQSLEATVVVSEIGPQGPAGPTGPTGAPGAPAEDDLVFSKRVDFVSDALLYRGEADPGSAESASVWRVRQITFAASDDDVAETWAGGTADFDKVWIDRAGFVYS